MDSVAPLRQCVLFLAAIWSASALFAQPPAIFPLKDIRAGQHGIGRTVFSGSKVEDFQVEILGVLENIGPKQSIILARLSGGPLAETGVMQGMSGSPVYIDGKLAGAVAMGFPLAKAPIAGIRPIEEMLRVEPEARRNLTPEAQRAALPPRPRVAFDNAQLEEIATPLSFSGFTSAVLDRFAPQLRQLGLEPRQGVSGGGTVPDALGDPKKLEPGSMISVQLLSGDMSVSADGTVTMIDGDKVYAFGHRFLATGSTELPFARSEVLALLPNLSASFKISQAREWMGVITEDRDTAVSGLTGRRALMTPIEIKVGSNTYKMKMIQDRVLSPLVAQMAVLSAIDATERSIGGATYSVRGRIDFAGGESLSIDNINTGDVSTGAIAALGIATPISYALSSGFDALRLRDVSLEITPIDKRSQVQIAEVLAPRVVHPGDDVEIHVVFTSDGGGESSQAVKYHVPEGAPTGILQLTVSDAASANLVDLQIAAGTVFRTPQQVLGIIGRGRSSGKAYLRIVRGEQSFTVEGRDLPGPPPSMAMILSRAQPQSLNLTNARGAKVAEIEVPAPLGAVTGSKTIQIEVKE
jgi:hypothetical protein